MEEPVVKLAGMGPPRPAFVSGPPPPRYEFSIWGEAITEYAPPYSGNATPNTSCRLFRFKSVALSHLLPPGMTLSRRRLLTTNVLPTSREQSHAALWKSFLIASDSILHDSQQERVPE